MNQFVNERDGEVWTASVVEQEGSLRPITLRRGDEDVDVYDFRLSETGSRDELVLIRDGQSESILLTKVGDIWWVHHAGRVSRVRVVERGSSSSGSGGGLTAPMPGKVLTVMASVGESVDEGQPLVVMEAMKMEHQICADVTGTVTAIHYAAGDQVDQSAVLVEIEPAE
jgi:acetyl/propionyl-CoA carboxylase alpha subunit